MKMGTIFKSDLMNSFSLQIQKVPRGKGLGGTGQINYLVHSFGKPEDYKAWPKGWSHADLLPYFKKVSDIMNVMSSPEEEYLAEAFLMAEESLKLNNVTLQKGLYTVKRGSRWSTFHAHLQNAWNRKNLHILTNTLVSKVSFYFFLFLPWKKYILRLSKNYCLSNLVAIVGINEHK